MNDSEKLVQEYLTRQGFTNVVYEPDGNVPPDFLVDGRIAVEVRRLNQNEETSTGFHGLEELAIPLDSAVRKVLASMGPPPADASWFVFYVFRRPLPSVKQIELALKVALTNFKNRPSHQPSDLRVFKNFGLRIFPAQKKYSTFFVLAGSHDRDVAGWMVSEIARNISLCVPEKTRKIAAVRDKYPEWWLVLDDRIGYGLDESDRYQLQKLIENDDHWDKIILVNPAYPGATELLVSSEL